MPTVSSAEGILEIGMGWFSEQPGGLNRMYAGLVGELARRGAQVSAVVAGDPAAGDPPKNIRFFAPADAHPLKRLNACRTAVKAALREQRIGIVAAHFAPYALPILDVVRGKRFVFHFHGPWAAESSAEHEHGTVVRVKRAIENAVYRRAHRFIVLSQAFGALLTETYGVRPELIHVIPGGVDAHRFALATSRAEARAALGLPADRQIVGVVRRLVHRVGLEGLLEAHALVRERVPEALLVIAGTGPLAEPLAAHAAALGLREHVRFLGFVGDERLPLFYRACDLSIVPSVALEGFGLTTIESLAAGTPVLVTPVGGLPETVRELDATLVLADTRPATIASAVSDSLTGSHPLPSADACADYARENFDWTVIAARTLAVYE
jgi:glycogen synthase